MKDNRTIGYIDGSFDVFHSGHANIIFKAASLCDILIVGVASDAMHIAKKKKPPTFGYAIRSALIEKLACVDMVIQHDYLDATDYATLSINIRFVGSDHGSWGQDQLNGLLWCISMGVIIHPIMYTEGMSSTGLKGAL